jgi:hypothetical protein
VGTFYISPTSSTKWSSSIDKGDGVWSTIYAFESSSGAVSCRNSTLAGDAGIFQAIGYVIISISSDNTGALGCKSSSELTERIFSRIDFPSLTVH